MFMRVRRATAVFAVDATEGFKATWGSMRTRRTKRTRVIVVERDAALECGRQLRRLRRSAGASLEDIGERANLSARRLAMAESGKQPLTPAEWRQALKALRSLIANRVTEGLEGLQSIAAS